MNTELVGLTFDKRAGVKVLAKKVNIQSCTGEDQFQCGEFLKHIPNFSEQEVSQTIALVYFILFKHIMSLQQDVFLVI